MGRGRAEAPGRQAVPTPAAAAGRRHPGSAGARRRLGPREACAAKGGLGQTSHLLPREVSPARSLGSRAPPSPHDPAPAPPEPRGTCESPHSRRPRLAVDHRPHDEDGEAGRGAEAGVGGAEAELPARRRHGLRAPGARASTACGSHRCRARSRSPSRRPPELRPAPPISVPRAAAAARTAPSLAGGRGSRGRGAGTCGPGLLGFLRVRGRLAQGQAPGWSSDPPHQDAWASAGPSNTCLQKPAAGAALDV